MFKFLLNCGAVFSFFVALESVLYYKDYNNLLVAKKYVEYEIKRGADFINYEEDYKIYIKGKKYKITFNRYSLFTFDRYKKIKYNGIVS